MAFDKTKDKQLYSIKIGNLYLSVYSYDEREPKVQIGPREIEKNDGSTTFTKPGRLSKDEFEEIINQKDRILNMLNNPH